MKSSQEEMKIDPEKLAKLGGRVYNHVPPERPAYDPQRPNGTAGILKSNEAPRHFEFDIKPD